MKQFLKRDRILVALIIVSLFVSLVPLAARVKAEQDNKNYDLVLDYSSLRAMVLQSEHDEGWWLDRFRSLGIERVALGESTIRNLSMSADIPIYASTIRNMRTRIGWDAAYPEAVVEWVNQNDDLLNAVVCAETKEIYEWICSAYEARTDSLQWFTLEEDGRGFICIPAQDSGLTGSDMLDLCLGIWPETERLVSAHGMKIVPRTVTKDGLNGATFAKCYLDNLVQHDAPYYINSGDSLVGWDTDEGKAALADFLRESGMGVGMFEENDQSQNLIWDGMEALLEDTGYNGIRFFNEWSYIQFRYAYCGYEGPEEITNSLFRAIAERNCKGVYFKMILEPDNDVSADADETKWTYITDPAAYEQLLNDLDTRLSALGYQRGIVSAMELDDPSAALLLVQAVGVAAAWVLLLDLFFIIGGKWRRIWLALAVLGFFGLAFAKPAAFRLILSMTGGIIMPSLAGVGLCRVLAEKRREQHRIGFGRLLLTSVGTGLLAVATAFGGSLLASSALSDLSYLIEMNLYRGVKLMQLVPIGFFGLAYLLVYAYEETGAKRAVLSAVGERGEKSRFRALCDCTMRVLDRPMKLTWFAAVAVIAVAAVFVMLAGVYYIYRTGNTMGVSSAELELRNWLENTLIARPRTKELLIGWPCLLLFVWSLRRHMNFLPLCFGLGMSIGLVSVVNTFLHIRTPLLLSLLRTGWGVLFGFLFGIACVAAAEGLYRLIRKLYFGGKHV